MPDAHAHFYQIFLYNLEGKMASDTARLRYLMKDGPDGFTNVEKDRYEYACEVAEENGREVPSDADELEGFRRMIDSAMEEEK